MNHQATASPPSRRTPPASERPTPRAARPEPRQAHPAEEAPSDSRFGGRKAVYTIIENGVGKPARWLRIGIAFPNRDGSFNIRLDALPVTATLHVRDFPPREGEESPE